jgi:tripartite-type tricarboxylate transporter receptor subunit TctC
MNRRDLLIASGALPFAATRARAQERTTRLIVPFAPGGGIDAMGRLVAQQIGPLLDETWVVENRSGGNGVVGSALVARAAPDGRTLLCSATGHLVLRSVMRAVPFDPIADFTPVARIAQSPLLLVAHAGVVPRTLPDLVADVRARPASYALGHAALGSPGHLAAEAFKRMAGRDLVIATYRGSGPAVNDLISGQIQLMFAPVTTVLGQVREGRMHGYAVTSPARSSLAPQFPSVAELGMAELGIGFWYGIWGPRGMPEALTARLNAAVQRVVSEPETVARLNAAGGEPIREDAAAFASYIAAEHVRMEQTIVASGIQPE